MNTCEIIKCNQLEINSYKTNPTSFPFSLPPSFPPPPSSALQLYKKEKRTRSSAQKNKKEAAAAANKQLNKMLGCFSRLKRPSPDSVPPPLPISDSAPSTSASSSSNSILFKNFNSIYDLHPSDDSETLNPATSHSPSPTATTSDDEVSPKDDDLCSAIASRRLLPACPGRSKSIVDSAAVSVYGIGSGVAVPTYSPDPYNDFKRSMEEMVEALGLDKRVHWARLHELLLCYLALNSKQTHKYIRSAFADLLLGLTGSKDEC
jgi:uncharacterized protein (TIGR01568 family)